ncbi:MAG: hypothetical protein ACI9FU_001620 [Granulosicoccus sp.]
MGTNFAIKQRMKSEIKSILKSTNRLKGLVLLVFIAVFGSQIAYAQDGGDDIRALGPKDRANKLFLIGDYKNALPHYIELLAEKPENEFFNYRVGLCHLFQNVDKKRAIKYLRKVADMEDSDYMALFELGVAYMFNEKLDSALYFFNKYKVIEKDPALLIDVTRRIEMCNSAKKFIAKPLDVTFKNLGTKVNSAGPDYNPFIPEDQSYLLFSTKREKGVAGNMVDYDGFKPPDVFMCKVKGNEFDRAKNASMMVNSEWIEELVSVSADGNFMYIRVDNEEATDDIWYADRRGRSWNKAVTLGVGINSDEPETGASSTPDGQTFYFARTPFDVPGFGGTDIFMTKRLPGGLWSVPVNLGPTINTQYDEQYPYVSFDGKTLYFSSMGHNSMGGYDVFKSEWDDKFKRWGRPKNLGYPVNNTQDNFTYCPSNDPRVAYVSQLRLNGLGDTDIYRIIYNDKEERLSAFVAELAFATVGGVAKKINFHVWKKSDGSLKEFTDEYQPFDLPEWSFDQTVVKTVKDGERFDITVIGSVGGGGVQKFTPATFPVGDDSFVWVDTRKKVVQVAKQGVSIDQNPVTGFPELGIMITISDVNGDLMGTYLPNYKTGRVVATLPVGYYNMTIKADGFQTIEKPLTIPGLGNYKPEIVKKSVLFQNGLTLPE